MWYRQIVWHRRLVCAKELLPCSLDGGIAQNTMKVLQVCSSCAGWHRRSALTHVCVYQVSDESGSAAAWQHMALTSSGPPLLFAGGADGRVSLFDLRVPADAAAACIRLSDAHLVRLPPAAPGRLQSAVVVSAWGAGAEMGAAHAVPPSWLRILRLDTEGQTASSCFRDHLQIHLSKHASMPVPCQSLCRRAWHWGPGSGATRWWWAARRGRCCSWTLGSPTLPLPLPPATPPPALSARWAPLTRVLHAPGWAPAKRRPVWVAAARLILCYGQAQFRVCAYLRVCPVVCQLESLHSIWQLSPVCPFIPDCCTLHHRFITV